jgi:hypothetical protein
MLVRITRTLCALMPLGLVTLSCSSTDCDRVGCNAIGRPASYATIETGLAGAAASQSDLVENGCADCRLTDGTLRVWESSTPIQTAEAAQALVDANGAHEDIEIHGTYEREKPLGEYLACVGSGFQTACAGITIGASQVVSVHVRYLNGPPEIIVFPPGESQPDTSRTFEVHTL